MAEYLHNHKDFSSLLQILADELRIQPALVEKDYWIMHSLYGLKQLGLDFELKGGTSLSKGFQIINRFSEDIDIHIKPPIEFGINENAKNTNRKNIEARKNFYNRLANTIKIDGIISVERDYLFDETNYYRSGGIRLFYKSETDYLAGIKEGILLEAGFDSITPNKPVTISSWAYQRALETTKIDIIDNRAVDVLCYYPGYTFVENYKLFQQSFVRSKVVKMNDPISCVNIMTSIACLVMKRFKIS